MSKSLREILESITPLYYHKRCEDIDQAEAEIEELHNIDLIAHERDIDNNYVHKSKIKSSQLTVEEIAECIDQVYDCDHNGARFIPNWETVAKAIATAQARKIRGEG